MLERCLKMLQNSIAYFQELCLSFVQFNVSYCGVLVLEAELMMICYFQPLGGAFLRIAFQKL
jgi:hypothetical protein